jgi:predicted lipoprotein with Yx(FWY)xxD motif
MHRLRPTAALAALMIGAAGCGDAGGGASPEAASAPAPTTTQRAPAPKPPTDGVRLKVVDSELGQVVGDAHGEALYLFDKERGSEPACYGECADAWPPALAKGAPVAGDGVTQRLLGTTRRRDGKLQVTYRDHPLYYYVGDAPGRILCQNVDEFGGRWLVVQPNGDPVG